MIDFQVGQEVVCVNASKTNIMGEPELVENQIYTIAWIGIYPSNVDEYFHAFVHGITEPIVAVRVHGVREDSDRMPFNANRFRPLKKKKKETDISVFKEILNTINSTQKEDA